MGTGLVGLDGGTNTLTTSYGLGWVQTLDTADTSWVRTMTAADGLHLAGSLTATDDNMKEMCGDQLIFYGQQGFNAVEVMMKMDECSAVAFNFGFNDEVTDSSNTLPIEGTASTITANSSQFCGIIYDADMTNDELHCYWVDDASATDVAVGTLRMRGASIKANSWLYMRVEMQDRGSGSGIRAIFHAEQDGKTFEKEFNTTLDRDVGLCWYLGVENRAALARGIKIRAPGWEQSIAD